MPLGQVRTHLDVAQGQKLPDLASDKWISTTTVSALLAYLSSSFSAAGIVKPEYFSATNRAKDMKKRIIEATKPFGGGKTHVLGIVNLDGCHWMAFVCNVASSECLLYDPYRVGRNERVARLRDMVDELLVQHLTDDEIIYTPHTDLGVLDQDDGNSCGVFCAVFLEMVLNDAAMSHEFMLPGRVYRARYITLLSILLRSLV
jgi:hypothetical protein